MLKFKVGDKVKLINKDVRHEWEDSLRIGTVYEVIGYHGRDSFHDKNHPTVRLALEGGSGWWVYIGSVRHVDVQMQFSFMYD